MKFNKCLHFLINLKKFYVNFTYKLAKKNLILYNEIDDRTYHNRRESLGKDVKTKENNNFYNTYYGI